MTQPVPPTSTEQATTTTTTATTPRSFPNISIPNLHNVASLFETLAFIAAAVLYLMNNGADQNHAIATALFGAIFHAYNH